MPVILWPEAVIRVRALSRDGRPAESVRIRRVWIEGIEREVEDAVTGGDGEAVLRGHPRVPGGRIVVLGAASERLLAGSGVFPLDDREATVEIERIQTWNAERYGLYVGFARYDAKGFSTDTDKVWMMLSAGF